MDKLQDFYDDAVDKQFKAKRNGKASGFINGTLTVVYTSLIAIIISIFSVGFGVKLALIDEKIDTICFVILSVGIFFTILHTVLLLVLKDATLNMARIKNDGIKEIETSEYEKHYRRSWVAGMGLSLIFVGFSFWLFWRGSFFIKEGSPFASYVFTIYRILYSIILVAIILLLKRIDLKKGYSKEWYTETKRKRPKLS